MWGYGLNQRSSINGRVKGFLLHHHCVQTGNGTNLPPFQPVDIWVSFTMLKAVGAWSWSLSFCYGQECIQTYLHFPTHIYDSCCQHRDSFIFQLKGQKLTKDWSELQSKKLHNLQIFPNIFRVIKQRIMACSVHGEMIFSCKGLVGKFQERVNLDDLGVDGKVTSNWSLGKVWKQSKVVLLLAVQALSGRGGITPSYSFPRH